MSTSKVRHIAMLKGQIAKLNNTRQRVLPRIFPILESKIKNREKLLGYLQRDHLMIIGGRRAS
ncbi:hypothetical protein [Bdellovibrio bacteriovorus]|uniref:hypothetical protein n=1 Tax=Bdellovibrio bacteriovorus TaxID=959 RepID=UPI003AA815BA